MAANLGTALAMILLACGVLVAGLGEPASDDHHELGAVRGLDPGVAAHPRPVDRRAPLAHHPLQARLAGEVRQLSAVVEELREPPSGSVEVQGVQRFRYEGTKPIFNVTDMMTSQT